MSQEEEFQYVVSKEDYSDFKTSQAKCQELAKLLAESQNIHSQDQQKYLLKIDKLEDDLKAYKSSIRQYVDRQVKEVDDLLKILHEYKTLNSKSSIDEKTFKRIKSQSDKIAQTFNVSLKNLQILNTEVSNLIKNLVQDSLTLQQKLKEFSQRYENAVDEKESLYEKVRQQNEKAILMEKEREKLKKSEQKLTNQGELLKIHLRQKQDQYTQHKISCEMTKNKLSQQIKAAKEEMSLSEKRWKEKWEMVQQKMLKEVADVRNEKLVATKTMIQEIQKLRQKCESLTQQAQLKSTEFKQLQIAYKQQSDELELQQQRAQQKQLLFAEKIQQQKTNHQKVISNYQTQLDSLTLISKQKSFSQEDRIYQLEASLTYQNQTAHDLTAQLNTSKQTIAKLQYELQSTTKNHHSQKNCLLKTIDQLKQQIQQKQLQANSWSHHLQILKNQLQQYMNKYQSISQSLQIHQQQSLSSKNTILEMKTQLSNKDQQINALSTQQVTKNQQINTLSTQQVTKNQQINALSAELSTKNQQINALSAELLTKHQRIDALSAQLSANHQRIKLLSNQLSTKKQRTKSLEQELSKLLQKSSQQIDQLTKTLAISQTQKTYLQENAKSITQQLLILQKTSNQDKNKLKSINQQLTHQLQVLSANLNKKATEFQELLKTQSQIKSAKSYAQSQFYTVKQAFEKEKKKTTELKQKLSIVGNESSILRQTFEESQISNESLLREIQQLRNQIRSSRQVEQASHLLKMNVNTLQTQYERAQKENMMFKKEKQLISQELSSGKQEIKFLNDDLNSMKLYIDELEQNLEKLSQEKAALKNELDLFKEQAEFCKKQSIDQLKIIDQLERQLELTKKQLKNASELSEPGSIVKRSSLSKGQKSYYVKEMIFEYGKEMKKNLDEIGALSHEQVKDLIFSQLRELGNFVKKMERDFE